TSGSASSPSSASKASLGLAMELWDGGASCEPIPAELLRSLLQLLRGKLPALGSEKDRELTVAAANAWFAQFSARQQRLRSHSSDDEVSGHSMAAMQTAALVGLEWLRYACRLLLLLAKHTPLQRPLPSENGAAGDARLLELRRALQELPPTKCSDVRNGFLAMVHRTTTGVMDRRQPGWWEEQDSEDGGLPPNSPAFAAAVARRVAAEALWAGGLRLGAALDLAPWAGLESQSSAGATHDQ
ncbi:unnamed protein product, partial [Polarella glacialis]